MADLKEFLYSVVKNERKGFGIGLLKFFLLIISFVYQFIVLSILFFYKTGFLKAVKIPKPVVSVGNLTIGGSGKTPLVEYLAVRFKTNNIKSVILARGYKSLSAEDLKNDEILMLEKKLPEVSILSGADRCRNAFNYLQKNDADVFILDDGFQHWKIKRDLNIVTVDSTDPFGNGYLLPRGVLREPISSLKRAQVVVLTKTDLGKENIPKLREQLRKINSQALIVEAVHEPRSIYDLKMGHHEQMSFLKNRKICVVASIAQPQSFERTLEMLGASVAVKYFFMDHHHFSMDDVKRINDRCLRENIFTVFITEKDAPKFKDLLTQFDQKLTIYVLSIGIKIVKGEDEFCDRIDRLS